MDFEQKSYGWCQLFAHFEGLRFWAVLSGFCNRNAPKLVRKSFLNRIWADFSDEFLCSAKVSHPSRDQNFLEFYWKLTFSWIPSIFEIGFFKIAPIVQKVRWLRLRVCAATFQLEACTYRYFFIFWKVRPPQLHLRVKKIHSLTIWPKSGTIVLASQLYQLYI